MSWGPQVHWGLLLPTGACGPMSPRWGRPTRCPPRAHRLLVVVQGPPSPQAAAHSQCVCMCTCGGVCTPTCEPFSPRGHSADELLLTEMMFNGLFNDLSAEQAAALLSCFVFQENVSVPPGTPRPRAARPSAVGPRSRAHGVAVGAPLPAG